MKRKLFSLFLTLAMVIPSFVIPTDAAGHTYYSQYGNGTGVDNKLCYLTSFAMVISDLGYPVSPYDIYKANGSTPVADFYRLGRAYGVTEYYRPQSGKTGAEKKQTIIRALQSGDYPEGFLVCTVVNGSVHMIVARKVVNGEVYFDCPANGCCITLGQTGHSPSWNNVTSYFGFIPNKNWKSKNYTVTFDFNCDEITAKLPGRERLNGSTYGSLPRPNREGYEFAGWYTAKTGGEQVFESTKVNLSADQTLYAHWTKVGCASHNKDSYKTVEQNGKYTAVCKTCGEEFVLGSLDTSVKGTYKPASGYVTLCSAPYQDADVKQTRGEVQVVGSVTNAYDYVWYKTSGGYWILGKYLKEVEPEEFCVYFDANGGTVSTKNKMVTNGEIYGALPTPTLSGYRFIGWYTGTDGGKRITSDMTVELYDELFVYARWEKEEEKCASHTKGNFASYEAAHPHYNYYKCANCGANFTDGTKANVSSCTTCNPPKEPVWGAWSSWSTSKVTATSTRQVETRQVTVSDAYTEYRYGRFVVNGHDCWCGRYLMSRPYAQGGVLRGDVTDWSRTRYDIYDSGWTCGDCGGYHSGYYETDSTGRHFWYEYKINGQSYYWEESRTIPAQYRTEYRYRDLK